MASLLPRSASMSPKMISESTSQATTDPSSPTGEVLGLEGTPNVTPPPTSTLDATTTTTGSPDALRIVLLGLAALLASFLLLEPKGAGSRR